jgi:hypothetical protein
MTVYYTQPDCAYVLKIVKRRVLGTGNYRSYYKKYYLTILTITEEELEKQGQQPKKPFF